MKLTDKIIEFIDKTPTLADNTTRMISQNKLGRWMCHARNLEKVSEKSSDISPIIERSLPEGLGSKIERLTNAIEKLYPNIHIDIPDEVEMYHALHDLKEAATSL